MTATFDHQPYVTDDARGDNFHIMLGDSCERLAEIEDDSVDLSIYSPPFAVGFVGEIRLRLGCLCHLIPS